MNKIYKVVWSKVKHCYVVTSELAKRNGKGCGARSLRMAAVSMGVAASLLCAGGALLFFSPSVAEAKIVNRTIDYTTVFDFQYSEKSVTVGATEIDAVDNVYGVFGNVAQRTGQQTKDSVSFKVVDGQLKEVHDVTMSYVKPYQRVLAGHPFSYTNGEDAEIENEINNSDGAKSDVSGYSVTVTGGSLQEVTGGLSNGGKVSNNTVNLNGGTAYKVYGGYTVGGAAETNHVVLNGGIAGVSGTIVSGGELYGAYSYNDSGNSGDVTGNTVTVKKGTVMATVYGGDTKAEGTGNQSGDAIKNTVTIEDGTLAGSIYGGYSSAQYKTSGNVEGNQVIIKGGVLKSAPVTINGTNYNTDGVRYIRGGYTSGYDKDTDTNASGIAKDNVVTISGGTLRSDTEVTGGYSNANNAEHNIVKIESTYTGTAGNVIGGEAGGNGTAKKNEVTISGGTVRDSNDSGVHVFGGKASTGSAIENKVTINKNATVNSHVDGGYTTAGTAENNEVTIDGGNVNGVVNGGSISYEGDTTPGAVTGNTVTIKNGSKVGSQNASGIYGGYVAGGRSYGALTNAGDVTGNKVFIMGGEVYDVYGGLSELGTVTLGSKTLNSGDVTKNEVEISGGTVSGGVYGGWTNNGAAGGSADAGNKVTVDGKASLYGVYGGYSQSGAVSYNTVDVKDCEWAGAFGGYSESGGAVSYNTVTMSDGNSFGLYGGENYNGTGDVTHNTVTLKGGSVQGYLFGGYIDEHATDGTGKATDNEVEISGGTVTQHGYGYVLAGGRTKDGDALDNTVTISAGEIGKWNGARNDKTTLQIAGGYVYGYKGKATGNAVDISGGTFGGAYEIDTTTGVETGELGIVVFGGYTNGTDSGIAASDNTVTISGSAVLTGAATVAGGTVNRDKELDPKGSADNNTITISGGTIGTGDKESAIYGGLGAASASNNTVTIKENATLNENTIIYGGKSALYYTNYSTWETEEELTGTASNNTVNISSAVTMNHLYGGAGGTAEKNTVTISDGTVNKTVYGGYGESGAATGNTVTITGGTVNGNVWGGFSKSGDPTKNSVTISGGTFNGQGIVGGYLQNKTGYNGSANENTVTISGGTFGGNVLFVQGGYTLNADNTTNNNTINLTGTVTGLENVSFYGGGSNASNTGNELHVGGIKGGDNGVWQGKTGDIVNNKVKYVGRFDKVVLHSVKWDKDVAALEATSVNNVKTLDITNLKFYTDAAGTTQKTSFEEGESMALLKSVESDLSSVKLDYKSGDTVVPGVAITTEGVILGGGATDKTETDGVNGVKLTQSVTEKVKLATDSKAISYSCEVGDVKGVTFGTMTWGTGRTAEAGVSYAAVTDSTVDATNLLFANPEAAAPNTTMKMLSGAKDLTAGTDITGHTQTFDHKLANNVSLNATLTGTVVRTTAGEIDYKALATTVNSVNLANWKGNASAVVPSGWTGKGVTVSGSFTGPELAANSSQDILTNGASGMFTDDAIADAIKYKAGVTFEGDEANGVTLAGTQSKGVKADDGGKKLVYAVGTKDVTGITLGNMKVGTPRDMNKDYNFAGITTLDASGLAFDKPENVNADVNLVTNAAGIPTGMDATAGKDHSQSFEQTAKNNVKLTANLKGAVKTDTNVVKYAYGGKELTKVDLKDWNGSDAAFDATGWTKGASAAVETAGLSVTVDPGVEKTVLTVSGVDLTGITVNGEAYQWKDGGESIAETSAENGVKITAGETTGGGIKGDGNKIIYKGSSKTVTGLEVTSVDFVKDGVARAFKNDYDLTNADITVASGISVSNTEAMNPGDTMVVVDATNAIKVAGKEKQTLKDFTTINAGKAIDFADAIDGKALMLSGTHQDTLEQNGDKNQILYKVGDKNVNQATFTGEVAWNDSEAYYTNDTSKYKITATNVDATALKVTGTSTKALQKGDVMTLLSAEGMTATLAKDQSDANKTASKITVNYSDATSGIGFGAEATGAVETAAGAVNYKVTGVTMNRVDLAGWNGTTSSVPGGWAIADGATINTDGLAAPAVEPGSHVDILQNDTDNYFASATISGANTYQSTDFKDEMNGVTLEGKQDKGVTLNSEKKHLIYAAGTKNTASVSFGAVEWQKDATLADAAAGYDFTNVAEIGTENFAMTYAKPEDVAVNDSMTLLKANETLTAIVNELKTSSSYNNYEIAPGVLMDGSITGTMSRSGNDVVFTATANQADKLTFTNVEWKDSGALLTRPANITFAGADVDTAKINFHNIQELAANSRMTLVSDFGETVGTITGDTFTVGSGLQGEGAASLSGTDLVFTAKTGAESYTPTEATHETVMAMEAGTAVVAAGREYVDSAVEGLGLVSNMAPDGTSTFASMGGGVGRYKTGSHVDTHTWNAVVAVGSKREHKKGSLEWGVFAEYGRGNYTLHDDNGGRGDGNTHYAGGGLLAKWTNKHDVYTEASFRMGRMSDSASNMLRDVLGNTYGYDVHANYFGGHVGLGKIYKVKGNKDLDVYGKFFYTRRNGVDFDAGGNHYSLDSVASKLLRIGARYGSNDRKWNWYGGLAYEYEFGGESKGTVDGLAIRSASIKGASVRGEIGVRLEATKTNPWKADISIYGYGGKHRGIGGTVSVAYMF